MKRQAWIPTGALFASLLYFARREQTVIRIPPHLATRTRSEASRLGHEGPCVEDIERFNEHCRTHLAAVDVVGTLTCDPSEGLILGQTSFKPGTLDGPWQGSYIVWLQFFYFLFFNRSCLYINNHLFLVDIDGRIRKVEDL